MENKTLTILCISLIAALCLLVLPAAAALDATFTISPPGPVDTKVEVEFTATTQGYEYYNWSFGDGSTHNEGLYFEKHTYSTAGMKTITLNVWDDNETGTASGSIEVNQPDVEPTASFEATPTSGVSPLAVSFDASASTGGGLSYAWDFGDGDTGSGETTSHTFETEETEDTFDVVLTVTNSVNPYPGVTDDATITVTAPVAPTAAFSVANDDLTVSFTQQSAGTINSYSWNFGDEIFSTSQSPSPHTYVSAGTYNITLTVTGPIGSDSTTRNVTVTAPVTTTATPTATATMAPITAAFVANTTTGTPPLLVKFTDTSAGSETDAHRYWDFGDSNTEVYSETVTHQYDYGGIYTVKLTVENSDGGEANYTRTDYIKVGYPPVADFSASPTTGVAPLKVSFEDYSDLNSEDEDDVEWTWAFGDGIKAGSRNVTHIYQWAGSYTVSLTVENPYGEDEEEETYLITVTGPTTATTAATYAAATYAATTAPTPTPTIAVVEEESFIDVEVEKVSGGYVEFFRLILELFGIR